MTPYLLTAAFSYFSGSIPFGYLLVRIFRGEDIRKMGSGNIGATNVSRKSPALGILTLLLDALKGLVPVMLSLWWSHKGHHESILAATSAQVEVARALAHPYVAHTFLLASIAAFFAIVGHIFPVWLHFRGGKGVATALGVFLVLATEATLIAFLVWCVCVFAWQYVSLASIMAAWSLPLAMLAIGSYPWTLLVLTSMLAALVTFRHRANVGRLLRGEEAQAKWTRPSR